VEEITQVARTIGYSMR